MTDFVSSTICANWWRWSSC